MAGTQHTTEENAGRWAVAATNKLNGVYGTTNTTNLITAATSHADLVADIKALTNADVHETDLHRFRHWANILEKTAQGNNAAILTEGEVTGATTAASLITQIIDTDDILGVATDHDRGEQF